MYNVYDRAFIPPPSPPPKKRWIGSKNIHEMRTPLSIMTLITVSSYVS